jgi:hypothetical protein
MKGKAGLGQPAGFAHGEPDVCPIPAVVAVQPWRVKSDRAARPGDGVVQRALRVAASKSARVDEVRVAVVGSLSAPVGDVCSENRLRTGRQPHQITVGELG